MVKAHIMNTKSTSQVHDLTPAMKRKALRDRIFTSAKPKKKIITFFGDEIELRQPSTGEVLSLRDKYAEDSRMAIVNMIIGYAYVPGTNDRVFEDADAESLLAMPFGSDMTRLQEAIGELTNIDVEGERKNSD